MEELIEKFRVTVIVERVTYDEDGENPYFKEWESWNVAEFDTADEACDLAYKMSEREDQDA